MPASQAITDFQLSCQKYYTCYAIAAIGLKDYADKMTAHAPDRNGTLYLGKGHPSEGHFQAAINIGDYIDFSERDGAFADQIAKAFVTAIYSEWEELYRHRIAEEAGVDQKAVKSNLMGDLRLIRHCVVHNKSIITTEHKKIIELNWHLIPGELKITEDMFSILIDQINNMQVLVDSE